MKTIVLPYYIRVALFITGQMLLGITAQSQDNIQKLFMGIELNNVLCGYSEILVKEFSEAQHSYLHIDQKTYISFKALGKDISQKQVFSYKINLETGNFIYHDSYIEQGEHQMSATMVVSGDSITLSGSTAEEGQKVFLPDDVILPNTMLYPYLKKDFGLDNLESKTYTMFDVRSGNIRETEYTNAGREKINLNNKEYEAIIVCESNPGTGLITKYWIDIESGLRLKMESQSNIKMYLADMSVVGKIKTGSWDDILFIKTNRKIKDIHGISSLHVKADMEVIPATSHKELNLPGQTFKGKVSGNLISGMFEVRHDRYRGDHALSFGVSTVFTEDVSIYLEAEEMIESDDPELVDLSLKITEGSADYWEAACRLSAWVDENIDGSVYGGSAFDTFKRGNGACGSQSLLFAALCRATGIPARVVWGCMYTPAYDGSFGHHGWNEVYMGESGWIPIDVTIHETDYIDSGHIRLGILETAVTVINFREMTIMD